MSAVAQSQSEAGGHPVARGGVGWQLALGDIAQPGVDTEFGGLVRTPLAPGGWVDYVHRWVSGTEPLYSEVLDTAPFEAHTRWMYDRRVDEPRLTAHWNAATRPFDVPGLVDEMRHILADRYGATFTSIGFALYRDGRDSVAWHGDTIGDADPDALVAIVSLGSRRCFRMRPATGSPAHRGRRASLRFDLHSGDLLVMGRCQRTWEHTVPKVATAGPRLSISFRHNAS